MLQATRALDRNRANPQRPVACKGGGAKLRAVQQATAAAREAARAATQQIISPRVTKAGDPPLAATSHATFSGGRFPLGTKRFGCAHAVSENGRAVHRVQR